MVELPPLKKHRSNGSSSKKHILLNAFDMSTVGHLSPGLWRHPDDKSATKRSLDYWINLAKTLERGKIGALFIADTYGPYEAFNGSADEAIRTATQFPVTDPTIPISAMAAVTKNLGFGLTSSVSYEAPFLFAKRFSTLDHLTNGRAGWNIVTSYKESASRAIGLANPMEHDERYNLADEYLEVIYKLTQSSWAEDALKEDKKNEVYVDPKKVRAIHHQGKHFKLETRHIVDPSPQRVPFLFQAGTSPAGSAFAAKHAEGIFVSGNSPESLRPRIRNIRKLAEEEHGRDPSSIKFYLGVCPILGKTDEEANEKYEDYKKYGSAVGGSVLFSGWTGIDLSQIPLDEQVKEEHSKTLNKIHSSLDRLNNEAWTPRKIGEKYTIGGGSPLLIGSPSTVADKLEWWIKEAEVDGFNLSYVITPGSFEDIVDLLVPELQKRGLYPTDEEYEDNNNDGTNITLRERVYGKGQKHLRDDHIGSTFEYEKVLVKDI